jgi:hypothetical protein
MKSKINHTKKYWNQYHDVTDIPKTKKNEKDRTCGITSAAMITGEHPDVVLKYMLDKHGKNDKFQWEENLIAYLVEKGFPCNEITKIAYPKPRRVTKTELQRMRDEIDKGNIIFYHKSGHYQLMIGYEGEDTFIFNDPAGNRIVGKRFRSRKSGFKIMYSQARVLSEKIFGRCWSVKI